MYNPCAGRRVSGVHVDFGSGMLICEMDRLTHGKKSRLADIGPSTCSKEPHPYPIWTFINHKQVVPVAVVQPTGLTLDVRLIDNVYTGRVEGGFFH